jgi:hypothetical protein
MAALSAPRNTLRQGAARERITVALKANAKVFKGGIVAVDATGYGVAGASAASLIVMGIAQQTVDNTGGASGALSVDVECGVFKLDNAGTNTITITSVGASVYMNDDHTLSTLSTSQSVGGKVIRLDADGSVWAYVGVI